MYLSQISRYGQTVRLRGIICVCIYVYVLAKRLGCGVLDAIDLGSIPSWHVFSLSKGVSCRVRFPHDTCPLYRRSKRVLDAVDLGFDSSAVSFSIFYSTLLYLFGDYYTASWSQESNITIKSGISRSSMNITIKVEYHDKKWNITIKYEISRSSMEYHDICSPGGV